jgi:hypothetical protein
MVIVRSIAINGEVSPASIGGSASGAATQRENSLMRLATRRAFRDLLIGVPVAWVIAWGFARNAHMVSNTSIPSSRSPVRNVSAVRLHNCNRLARAASSALRIGHSS